jgi:hypothetical protein
LAAIAMLVLYTSLRYAVLAILSKQICSGDAEVQIGTRFLAAE